MPTAIKKASPKFAPAMPRVVSPESEQEFGQFGYSESGFGTYSDGYGYGGGQYHGYDKGHFMDAPTGSPLPRFKW